ncbi:hypothetical protein SVAN01_00417, partial [Stagonosporopsis vannaccii]
RASILHHSCATPKHQGKVPFSYYQPLAIGLVCSMSSPSQSQSQFQSRSQSQGQSQSQRKGVKRKRRTEHDAELLPLLQGQSVEVKVGTGVETASWTIPVALLTKHSSYLQNTFGEPGDDKAMTPARMTLADREPAVFRIFVQWIYFGTVPDRLGLSRLSTGKAVSNSFLLWTLGDYLQADAFKDKIMRELYASYSLEGYHDECGFVEFTAAEIDYCWSQTTSNSKLRKFVLETLSHHVVFGDYVRVTSENDWYKLFVKHADLQMQIIATIASSSNFFGDDVTEAPELESYLEVVEAKKENEAEEIAKP